MTSNVGAMLRSTVERVERIEEEIKGLNTDKSEIYQEAKGHGFDVKALKAVVARRRKSAEDRREHDELVNLYEREVNSALPVRERAREEAKKDASRARAREGEHPEATNAPPSSPTTIDPFQADDA